jgi:DNA-directed RNA polymerase subunit M/transcription elongation factor TFIIS
MHKVKQSRFSETEEYLFDLDISESDEYLIKKIEKEKIEWKEIFHFGRGVEISKAGKVVICDQCNTAQGFTKKQEKDKFKKCVKCGKVISINHESVVQIISDKNIDEEMEKIYVGENLHRYRILGKQIYKMECSGHKL